MVLKKFEAINKIIYKEKYGTAYTIPFYSINNVK